MSKQKLDLKFLSGPGSLNQSRSRKEPHVFDPLEPEPLQKFTGPQPCFLALKSEKNRTILTFYP